jgi:hypothetical protein
MPFSQFTYIPVPGLNVMTVQQLATGNFVAGEATQIYVNKIDVPSKGFKPAAPMVLSLKADGQISDITNHVFSNGIPVIYFAPRIGVVDLNRDGYSDVFVQDGGADTAPFPGGQNSMLLSAQGANLVSTDTGTLQLRGVLDNPNYKLIPGLYARVMAKYGPVHAAILIPSTSVLEDQQGNYVFILDTENKARRQNIILGQAFGSMVEVLKGLEEKPSVVINGFINLSEGQLTSPKEQPLEAITIR